MDLVLIPGFWLEGASWDDVAAPLRNAGHTVPIVAVTVRARGVDDDAVRDRSVGPREHV